MRQEDVKYLLTLAVVLENAAADATAHEHFVILSETAVRDIAAHLKEIATA